MVDRRWMTRVIRAWGATKLAHAVAALALAVFALAPSVEAAVCAVEPSEVSASLASETSFHAEVSAPSAPDEVPADQDQEACPHGHCHHAPGVVAPAIAEEHLLRDKTGQVTLPPSQAPPTLHPALPKRPPRS